MVTKTSALLACLALLATVSVGCGGVKTNRDGEVPLKLLDLSPRDGEVGVALNTDVVAVFSVPVALANSAEAINDQTFYVTDAMGTRQSATLEMSELDLVDDNPVFGGTAIIRLVDLTPGADYTIVVAGTLEGTDSNPTAPLGVDIEATFTVAN